MFKQGENELKLMDIQEIFLRPDILRPKHRSNIHVLQYWVYFIIFDSSIQIFTSDDLYKLLKPFKH